LCPTCNFALLTDFTSVTFTGAQAAVGGALRSIASFTAKGGPRAVTMTGKAGVTRSRPGTLGTGGTTFTATWAHS
jgi:hypothetical protein